jgi:hypothetical protein
VSAPAAPGCSRSADSRSVRQLPVVAGRSFTHELRRAGAGSWLRSGSTSRRWLQTVDLALNINETGLGPSAEIRRPCAR